MPISNVSDRQQQRDCEEYRDFESAFIADVGSETRAVFLLSEILKGVESGNARFPITCVDQRSTMPGTSCDGRKVLASLELKQLDQVDNVGDRDTRTTFLYTDTLLFWAQREPNEHPETIELSVESVQTIGQQSAEAPTLREVHVSLHAL